MLIRFSCSCGKELTAQLEHAGKRALCPSCGVVLVVPDQSAAPASLLASPAADGPSVKHLRTERQKKMGKICTYHVYSAPSEAEALAFLEHQLITDEFDFFVVETPKGSWGRDIEGIYQEEVGR